MSQNDYIILRDEDGKAYIAHAGLLDNARNAISTTAQQVANKAKGVGRRVRQNHKYILKVLENGKTRYFYKQEEVKAYYEAKKRGIKNAAEYAQNAVKDKASDVADAAKNVASKAGDAARSAFREATGQAARDRMDAAAARRDTEAVNMHNANTRRQKAENDKAIAEQKRAEALSDIKNARTAQRGLQEKIDKDTDRINAVDRKKNNDEYVRRVDSWNLSQRALDTQRQKEMDGYRRENSSANKISAAKKEIDSATSEHIAARDAYQEADSNYNKNKAAYDKSLAGAVDRTTARAKETASSAFSKAKDAANNTVSNAKNAYDRMKSEFRDKAEQVATKASDTVKDIAGVDERKERDRTRYEAEKPRADVYDAARANIAQREYDKTPLGMIDRARTAVKDKSEDLSAKAKSTAQSARDSVKGMIDNARSSTAKAVNEAWDRIPKNSDGTVNPFDKNFQSTYNDWKTKKDKYDSSLTGRAKDAAEKATDSIKDMIDQAKKFKKNRDGSAEQGFKDVVDFINIAGQYRREAEARGRGYITNTIAGHTQSYSVLPPRDSQWRKDQEHADELATKINRTVNDYINGDLSLDDAKQKVENYKSELDSIDFEQYNDRKVRTPSKADATGRARARQFGSDTVSVPIESTKQTAEEQRSNDKRAAQRLSTSAELKGGEYVSLIDKYKQRYGEDYQNYLSKDEASKLQKARDNYQTAVEDANRAWDEFEKKWSKNK